MADLMEVVNHWLQAGCPAGCEQADIDGSGQVDLGDMAILAGNWMEGRVFLSIRFGGWFRFGNSEKDTQVLRRFFLTKHLHFDRILSIA